MKRKLFPVLILTAALAGVIAQSCAGARGADDSASARATPNAKTSAMKIRIKLENKTLTANLDDNATVRDFVSLLPVTLTLRNFAVAEKISELPRKLSIEGAPAGYDPNVKDIAYYGGGELWRSFYKDPSDAEGLIKLGNIDGDVEALNTSGPVKATIELVQ